VNKVYVAVTGWLVLVALMFLAIAEFCFANKLL
jgi:hypothetical protein